MKEIILYAYFVYLYRKTVSTNKKEECERRKKPKAIQREIKTVLFYNWVYGKIMFEIINTAKLVIS